MRLRARRRPDSPLPGTPYTLWHLAAVACVALRQASARPVYSTIYRMSYLIQARFQPVPTRIALTTSYLQTPRPLICERPHEYARRCPRRLCVMDIQVVHALQRKCVRSSGVVGRESPPEASARKGLQNRMCNSRICTPLGETLNIRS